MNRFTILLSVLVLLSACSAPLKDAADWKDLPFQVHSAVQTSIDLGALYFHSRDTACRSPFGAVKQGTPVTLRFRAKSGDLSGVNLVLTKKTVFGNNENQKNSKISNLPMTLSTNEAGKDVWVATVSFPDIGVYGYYFELTKDEKDSLIYGNNFDGVEVPYVQVKGTGGYGRVTMPDGPKWPYVLTVYRKDLNPPAWASNLVIYYIFPDRFRNGNTNNDPVVGVRKFYGQKDIEFHTNWLDVHPWVPGNSDLCKTDDKEYCNDFYGGDLDGILSKLDYLAGLGVNLIYINPIFRAPSNHKYDTADYLSVDEAFGDMPTFERLVAEAKKRGIRIMTDTSLNHCGSDSVYMDRYGKYPTLGAFEGEKIQTNSPYYSWFTFAPNAKDADHAYSQWANPTLATLKEVDGWKDFAFRKPDSVTKFWLSKGLGGWRMDVTPWKTDPFWREWHAEVKKDFPEALTISEVWFDASKYLLGDMYDGTMNYIFRSAAISLAKGGDTRKVSDALGMMAENYPLPALARSMNLISSHDLPRLAWEIGYKNYGTNWNKYRAKVALAMALQFLWAGSPTVYYGDEVGMTGGPDPDNRGPFPWKDANGVQRAEAPYGDPTMADTIKSLVALRKAYPALTGEGVEMLEANGHLLPFIRSDGKSRALVVLNNGNTLEKYALPAGNWKNPDDLKTVLAAGTEASVGAWDYSLFVE